MFNSDGSVGTSTQYDLIIVGSGLIGAIVANRFLQDRPAASLAIVEAGGALTGVVGEHLIATTDSAALDATYHRLMAAAREVAGSRRETSEHDRVWAQPWSLQTGSVGLMPAQFAGHDMTRFPGAVMAWNVGGMGVHWTAACPWPWGPELVPGITTATWARYVRQAQRLLRVSSGGYRENPFSAPIIAALNEALPGDEPGRKAQTMPMAGITGTGARVTRTGPVDVLPQLRPDSTRAVTLMQRTLCTRIVVRKGRACAVVLRDVVSAAEREVSARVVVVAADALRTPQLLQTSGVGGPALGRYLNEHACLSAPVAVDHARLGMVGRRPPVAASGEPFLGAYWCPSQGPGRPVQTQLMETIGPDGHMLRVSVYAATQVRAENCIEFSDTDLDFTGMPRMRAHFDYSDADLAVIEGAQRVHQRASEAIGVTGEASLEILPAGSSLHYTGTARMGQAEDGTSVCDVSGRVWGTSNLFVAGNAVIPTALTCNSTLTSAALAIGTGHAAAALLFR